LTDIRISDILSTISIKKEVNVDPSAQIVNLNFDPSDAQR